MKKGIKAKEPKGRRITKEEGRSDLEKRSARKRHGRKYNFKPAVLMHFHSAADI